MNLHILPNFRGEDKGEGGIRRVVEAQKKHLPKYGFTIVDDIARADIVAVHGTNSVNTNRPIVNHCHGLYWSDYNWDRWAYSLNADVAKSMNSATLVTAPSKWVAEAIKRGSGIDAIPIYHGIDVEDWTIGTNQGYVLWNKTRVDPVCDPEPMNRLAEMAHDVQFVSTFGKQTTNVKITGKLPFNEAKKYIENSSIYLCTPRETFGIGTLEAMICGVPILGWKWGGQEEFIENKIHGWLAIPGDFESLLEGLRYIQEHREELSQNCIQTIKERFTWDAVIEDYVKVYKDAYELENTPVKVSVVIPCYNLGNMVRDAVESVTKQKFADYEVVIVDDASTDDTPQKLVEIASSNDKVRIVTNEKNQYLAGALNTGIAAAQGRYVIPLDADNMLGNNTLQILSDALDADRNCHVVYGSMEVIEPDGKRFISQWPPPKFDLLAQLSHRNQCPSTSMYRKNIWKRVGGYRSRCRTAEDADFWCRVGSFGGNPKKVTDAPTLIYRNRHDSMSHTQVDWQWNEWYTWGREHKLLPFMPRALYGIRCEVESCDPVKISIIIPCGPGHNNYLPDAIDSVMAQTFTKWEIIVINDSGEEIKNIFPIAKILQTPSVGSGPAAARNIGITASKGPLFLLLDADDYLQPRALELMFNDFLSSHGYVYSDWIVQETGETYETPEYDCEEILRHLPHAVTALYPKRAWIECGGFDESLKAWEDWDFIISINAAGYCGKRVASPLFQYRKTTGTLREAGYANKEELKEQIRNKWSEYITGGKKLAGCGGCGGNRNRTRSTQPASTMKATPPPVQGSDLVLIEYTRDGMGATSYKGPTKNIYRFGSDSSHRRRYVYKEDVNYFISLGYFKIVSTEIDSVLEAKGPPVH